jgi:hypothetical protein
VILLFEIILCVVKDCYLKFFLLEVTDLYLVAFTIDLDISCKESGWHDRVTMVKFNFTIKFKNDIPINGDKINGRQSLIVVICNISNGIGIDVMITIRGGCKSHPPKDSKLLIDLLRHLSNLLWLVSSHPMRSYYLMQRGEQMD